MARLIDADALIDFIDCGHLRNPFESCFSERDVVNMLEARPTVDAVEVVRCCDCINHRVPAKDECGAIQFLYCCHPLQEEGDLMLTVDFTDYCSSGCRESEGECSLC